MYSTAFFKAGVIILNRVIRGGGGYTRTSMGRGLCAKMGISIITKDWGGGGDTCSMSVSRLFPLSDIQHSVPCGL